MVSVAQSKVDIFHELRATVLTRAVALTRRIEFHHLMAGLFMLLTIAVAKTPLGGLIDAGGVQYFAGPIGWLKAVSGIPPYLFVILFALSAVQLGFDPGPRQYILCMFPLILYTVANIAYTQVVNPYGLSSSVYLGSIILFCLVLRFKKFGGMDLRRVFAVSMMLLGTTFLEYPDRGVVGWMSDHWAVSGDLLALTMMIGALLLSTVHFKLPRHNASAVLVFGFPYLVYGFSVLVYVSDVTPAAGTAGIVIALMSLILFFNIGLRTNYYVAS